MSVALDLGSHSFRSLRLAGSTLIGRKSRAVYSVLADTDAHRRLLDKTDTTFLTCDSGLVIVGDSAVEISQLLQRPFRVLLPGGRVPAGDPLGRQVLNVLLEAVLPAGDRTPAAVILPLGHDDRTAEFLSGLVKLRGYEPVCIPAGYSLLLAESAPEQFTGVAIVAGHSGLEIIAAHLGRVLDRVCLSKAGQWLDDQLSRQTGDGSQSVERHCRELAWDIAGGIGQLLASAATLPRPATVLCGGGLSHLPGFADLIREALNRRETRAAVAAVRLTDPSPYTNARGGLIHLELESQALPSAA